MSPTPFNEHVRLAQAMLHGHLWVEPLPGYMEHVSANGHQYILHPVGNALVCLPFVAAGVANQTTISIILGIVSVLLCAHLTYSLWLTAFYLLGTTFLYEATLGASWNFCLVASTVFTFAALCELRRNDRFLPCWDVAGILYDDRRVWRIAFFAACAALCRNDLVLAWPVYGWVIYADSCRRFSRSVLRPPRVALVQIGVCALFAAAAAAIYGWYNYERFGTFTDQALWLWYAQDNYRVQRPYGPFSIRYLPWALYTLLFMAPGYQGAFPWIRPQFMGQALLSLSPAFLTVAGSPYLVAAFLCSFPALTVYANGFSQLGCRYYVQVYPFLIAAMMPAGADGPKPISIACKRLIALSIALSLSQTLIVWVWGLA